VALQAVLARLVHQVQTAALVQLALQVLKEVVVHQEVLVQAVQVRPLALRAHQVKRVD